MALLMALLACVDMYTSLSHVRLGAHCHQRDINGGGTTLPCSPGTVGDVAGAGRGRGERAYWPMECECMICGGR
jgi:hypothetical protein